MNLSRVYFGLGTKKGVAPLEGDTLCYP